MGTAGLNPLRVGLTIGILWAGGVLFLGLAAALLNWGNAMVSVLGSLYLGYAATVTGSLIGMVWAFFDGLIGGAVFAVLYNYLGKLAK